MIKEQEKIIEEVSYIDKILEENKKNHYGKLDCHSLLIENLTKEEMEEIKNFLVLSNAIIKEI